MPVAPDPVPALSWNHAGMPISAVLFDVDGVLWDSAAAHRRVWTSWSRARGLDPEKVWTLTFGRRPEDTVRDAAPHLDPTTERKALDELLARKGEVSRRWREPPVCWRRCPTARGRS